jgi:hypothetical protein
VTLNAVDAPHPAPLPAALAVPLGGPQVLVLDTGVIYNDIVRRLRNPGKPGVLLGSARKGATVLLAADHVYDEVYDSLRKAHARRAVTHEAVTACFEREYLPQLRFVSMPLWPLSPRVLRVGVRDADDAPTASLALLVAPCLVFAIDRHLVDAGFGVAEQWLTLAWEADDLLGYDSALLLSALGARALWQQTVRAVRWFTDDLSPREVLAGAALAALTIAAAPRIAEAVDDTVRRAGGGMLRASGTIAATVTHLAVERHERAGHLTAASVAPEWSTTALVARRLVVSRDPLDAADVAMALHRPLLEVLATLHGHRAFVRTNRGWQLGRHRLPRGRELAAG